MMMWFFEMWSFHFVTSTTVKHQSCLTSLYICRQSKKCMTCFSIMLQKASLLVVKRGYLRQCTCLFWRNLKLAEFMMSPIVSSLFDLFIGFVVIWLPFPMLCMGMSGGSEEALWIPWSSRIQIHLAALCISILNSGQLLVRVTWILRWSCGWGWIGFWIIMYNGRLPLLLWAMPCDMLSFKITVPFNYCTHVSLYKKNYEVMMVNWSCDRCVCFLIGRSMNIWSVMLLIACKYTILWNPSQLVLVARPICWHLPHQFVRSTLHDLRSNTKAILVWKRILNT